MRDALEARRRVVLAREQAIAAEVAAAVVPPPALGPFALFFPPVLVPAILRVRGARAFVSKNALVTKRLALSGAESIERGRESEEGFGLRADRDTRAVLAADHGGAYSDGIRLRQMAEVVLLVPHYRRLLRAAGQRYRELVRSAYGAAAAYRAFAEDLVAAETAVIAAAREFLGPRADPDFAERLAEAAARARRRDVDFVFGGS